MIPATQLSRLLRISRVFERHGLDEFVTTLHLFRPYRWLLHLLPWRWVRRDRAPRAVRLRQALEELGPIFVKFGQVLSTRPDLLPDDIAAELAKLQDQVASFPGDHARQIVADAYGEPLEAHFSEFSTEPVASASVAQVHYATLQDGTPVAVKVLRPGIEQVIGRDLKLLYTLADLAVRFWSEGRRLRPREVVDQFSRHLDDELDMMREGANASQLRSNFADSELMYVPEIYWDHTRRKVLVMERIEGIPISDVEALRAAGIDMRRLAHNGVEIFFTQAFRDGFFHADMHPGNVFVTPEGQYRAVDFGIMGILNDVDKRYLAENFLGFFNRDYRAVADAHLRARWVPADTRADEFEAAIRTVCEPIFARPISEISFGRLLVSLFRTARRFNMEIQPQLVLLQKTLLNIEGLGRRLYPELDLWETAKPFLERWMREKLGPRAFVKTLREQAPFWLQAAPQMPGLVQAYLQRAGNGELGAQWRVSEMEKLRAEMRLNHRRLFLGVVGSSLVISAAVIAGLDGFMPTMLAGAPLLSWILGGGGVLVLWIAWPRRPR